ncbi:MAG TPA: class I SAM-dependent methyltransferase [Nitriliruptorales bacterium]|nr:class I SAM-dependent methyltransferase [Nitriliruptorales bacterium]
MTDLTPDQLQIAFHDVECHTYDARFGIAYDRRTLHDAAREARRLLGGRPFGRVLDVGCGTGYVGLGLAASQQVGELHATDIAPGMLQRAAANADTLGLRTHLVRATGAQLPYRDGAFDAVVCRGVLHHLHDPVAALREWRRVTRRGGPVVVLSEPTPLADAVGGRVARATLAGLRAVRRAADAVGRPLSAHDAETARTHGYWDLVAMAANLHTFTPAQLAALGRDSGFRRVRVRGVGLASIAWAAAYHVLVGELPSLQTSAAARRRAGLVWTTLRRLDAAVFEPLLPAGALLTVQAVFTV